MSAKNKPIYELFCKGIMNRKHKGLRFDENGNVVCEPNAEFGADVEVDGSLTINSAKDLKTKDGTSFGGGGLPSPWVANENVLGYEDTDNQLVVGFLTEGGNLYGYQNNQLGEVSYVSPVSSSSQDIVVYLNVKTQVDSVVALPDDFVTKSQVINLGDINKKQSILYRHTVTFRENGLAYTNIFTAYSEKNTPIDSIQDLIAVFGNTELMCTGTIESGSNPCIGIRIGTTADTILFLGVTGGTQKLSSWYSTGPDTTLEITDNVTAM